MKNSLKNIIEIDKYGYKTTYICRDNNSFRRISFGEISNIIKNLENGSVKNLYGPFNDIKSKILSINNNELSVELEKIEKYYKFKENW